VTPLRENPVPGAEGRGARAPGPPAAAPPGAAAPACAAADGAGPRAADPGPAAPHPSGPPPAASPGWRERVAGARPRRLLEVAVFPGWVEMVEHYGDGEAALGRLGVAARREFVSPCG
jgi:hypothetical protein